MTAIDAERWDRVKRVFQSALERPVDEREAFLRLECAGDDALLHEVRSLVAAGAEADSFLDTPPIELKPRTHLGSYEIISRIGAGGMGEVYRARDSRIAAGDRRAGEFRAGPAKVLFEAGLLVNSASPDAQRFLGSRVKRVPRWEQINIVSGWWND